jgi:hemerythrin superfamily protein
MTENNGLPFPEWQVPAQDVLLETNREKLPEKLRRAEEKIFHRLRQLQESSDGHHERDALSHALSLIREIKRERMER